MIAHIEIISIVLFGLFGSLGHCIGMCGGFIITYTSAKISPDLTKNQQAFRHLLYNFGRISSYTILGALFGAFGALWDATPELKSVLYSVSGAVMFLMGLSLLGKIRFLTSIEYNLTTQSWYKKLFHLLMIGPTLPSFFFLGMLNGLFPCGLVYAALVWAMATGSWASGALVMLLFGLATLPALFSFGLFVGFLKQYDFRDIMIKLASITILVFAAWTLFKAYENVILIQNPSAIDFNSTCH